MVEHVPATVVETKFCWTLAHTVIGLLVPEGLTFQFLLIKELVKKKVRKLQSIRIEVEC